MIFYCMLLIREVFTAKPGMASKFATLMKEVMASWSSPVKIMTDMVGEYNTVVMEYEVEDLTAFEKMMAEYSSMKPEDKAKMAGYTDMYQTGRREIYRIW